jgi:hypothetical protein
MRGAPVPVLFTSVLLAACGGTDNGELADSVRGAVDRAYEKSGATALDENKTTGAECVERSGGWRCTVSSDEEALVYDVAVGSNDCWRGKLAETRDTSARAIPVQLRVEPRRGLESPRGCL